MTTASAPGPIAGAGRPPLPGTPALSSGLLALRSSWGWRSDGGPPVGTVGFLGVRADGRAWRVEARVLTVAVLRLPDAATAPGHGLSVQRGLRRRAGGRMVATERGLRRVGRDAPVLEGLVVLADRELGEPEALALLGPTILDALRPRDLAFDWQDRDLVVHAAGILDAAGRADLGRSAETVADALRSWSGVRSAGPIR